MNVYLAGPMTGRPFYNFKAFDEAARVCRLWGWSVVTPFDNDSIVWQRHYGRDFDPFTDKCDYGSPLLDEMLVENVKAIQASDAIAFLPDWRLSRGATMEHMVGTLMGRKLLDAATGLPLSEETICHEADRLVSADRQQDYGHPLDDFSKTAKMWSAIFGIEVTAEQVPLAMIAVKISREMNRPKRDNLVDIAGYAKTLDLVHTERKRRSAA